MGSGGGSEGGGGGLQWVNVNYALLQLRAVLMSAFGLDPNAIFIWDAFKGLPSFVKTMETGQRLVQSHIPAVSVLGLHFCNLAKNGHILSNDADLKQYFGPSMKFTTSCLFQYEPTPINKAMQDVVFGGEPVTEIAKAYLASNPPWPKLLNKDQFLAINPNHIFPEGYYKHLLNIWP